MIAVCIVWVKIIVVFSILSITGCEAQDYLYCNNSLALLSEECNAFINCTNKPPTPERCPSTNFHFDTNLGECIAANKSNCTNCGGDIMVEADTRGSISWPRIDGYYDSKRLCRWNIKSDGLCTRLAVTFTKVDIEDSEQCKKDYVNIYIDGSLNDTICGLAKPAVDSCGRNITIELFADGEEQLTGFKLEYICIAPNVTYSTAKTTEHKTTATRGTSTASRKTTAATTTETTSTIETNTESKPFALGTVPLLAALSSVSFLLLIAVIVIICLVIKLRRIPNLALYANHGIGESTMENPLQNMQNLPMNHYDEVSIHNTDEDNDDYDHFQRVVGRLTQNAPVKTVDNYDHIVPRESA